MPKMILIASYLSIAGNNISSYCSKIELSANVEKKDTTTFASNGFKEVLGGLGSGQLSIELFNDLVDNDLDEDMWTLLLARVPVAFEVRADNAVVGASNPKWTGLVLIDKWSPVSGKVGDINAASYSWDTSGAITRAVA